MTNEKDECFQNVLEGVPIQQFMEKTVEALKPYMSEGASLEVHMTLFLSDSSNICVNMVKACPTVTLKTTRKN